MARIRSIKPEFFLHDELAELSFGHRLLFIGLWTLADKDGRLRDQPKRIKAALFPWDDLDVDAFLDALAGGGFVQRYEVDGQRYLSIPGWSKHQKLHKDERSCNFPAPPSREISRQAAKFPAEPGNFEGRGIRSTRERSTRDQRPE